jgi:hypothetical protein
MPNVYAVHNAEASTELGNVKARMRDLAEAVDNLIERKRGAAAPAAAPASYMLRRKSGL